MGLPKHHNSQRNGGRSRGNFPDYLKLLQALPSVLLSRKANVVNLIDLDEEVSCLKEPNLEQCCVYS
jgi:hypothetical protein